MLARWDASPTYLREVKYGKTPGLDGIPVEVYQTFFSILRGPLLACFNHHINNRLSDTQQGGLISLLLKQDPSGIYKDPVHLKNWRPHTLQCCDAKILAKCLVHIIKKVLSDIIHPNQTGFLHGQHIGVNIKQVLETITVYLFTYGFAYT